VPPLSDDEEDGASLVRGSTRTEENLEAASGLGETVQAGWQRVQHDQRLTGTYDAAAGCVGRRGRAGPRRGGR
jgi:hypothetical protein